MPVTPNNSLASIWLGTNIPPVVDEPIEDIRMTAGEVYQRYHRIDEAFYDANADFLTYELTGLPDGVRYEPGASKSIRLIGTPTTAGTYTVTIKASDNTSSVSTTFKIHVAEAAQGRARRAVEEADFAGEPVEVPDPDPTQSDML